MIIQDEMLRAAIARTLQIEETDITEKKLEELTTLSARSSGIISLEGLQYAVNLKYLDLCGNAIEDLTPIRDLREIEVLNRTLFSTFTHLRTSSTILLVGEQHWRNAL